MFCSASIQLFRHLFLQGYIVAFWWRILRLIGLINGSYHFDCVWKCPSAERRDCTNSCQTEIMKPHRRASPYPLSISTILNILTPGVSNILWNPGIWNCSMSDSSQSRFISPKIGSALNAAIATLMSPGTSADVAGESSKGMMIWEMYWEFKKATDGQMSPCQSHGEEIAELRVPNQVESFPGRVWAEPSRADPIWIGSRLLLVFHLRPSLTLGPYEKALYMSTRDVLKPYLSNPFSHPDS